MKNLISAFAIITVLCCSCDNSAPETASKTPTIYATLYVRYIQPDQQIKAEATFYEGDSLKTALPKAITGGTTFQNSGMGNRTLQDQVIRYGYENTIEYPAQFSFGFKDGAEQPYTHNYSMSPTGDFSIKEAISKTRGMTLILEGESLKKGERLVLLFSDAENKAYTVEMRGPTRSKEIPINAKQLEKLPVGKGQLYLVKKKLESVKLEFLDINAAAEYYTHSIDIEVVE